MKIIDIDTPALIINEEIVNKNLNKMQEYANKYNVILRPHTKTHKSSYFAKKQLDFGASGITVAKLSEAEIMFEAGLSNIFIANQVVSRKKLQSIKKMSEYIDISFGVDNVLHIDLIDEVFKDERKANILIEIEVGEQRSGIINDNDFIELLHRIKQSPNINFKGIFSHDGHTYSAESIDKCKKLFQEATQRTIEFSNIAKAHESPCEIISIGSTPPFLLNLPIPKEITEIRPGTYIFMDGSQANIKNDISSCAATILSTIISKPTNQRVIADAGAKALTMQKRQYGITKNLGLGKVLGYDNVYIDYMFDEHSIINNKAFSSQIDIANQIKILPNHICPVTNLYDFVYLINGEEVTDKINISCRGKLQ